MPPATAATPATASAHPFENASSRSRPAADHAHTRARAAGPGSRPRWHARPPGPARRPTARRHHGQAEPPQQEAAPEAAAPTARRRPPTAAGHRRQDGGNFDGLTPDRDGVARRASAAAWAARRSLSVRVRRDEGCATQSVSAASADRPSADPARCAHRRVPRESGPPRRSPGPPAPALTPGPPFRRASGSPPAPCSSPGTGSPTGGRQWGVRSTVRAGQSERDVREDDRCRSARPSDSISPSVSAAARSAPRPAM